MILDASAPQNFRELAELRNDLVLQGLVQSAHPRLRRECSNRWTVQQLSRTHAECVRNRPDVQETHVALSALNGTYICPVKPTQFREPFLGPTSVSSNGTHTVAEGTKALLLIIRGHQAILGVR